MDVQEVVRPAPQQRLPRRLPLQRDEAIAYLFVAPALILIVVIAFFPILQAIWLSFQKYYPSLPTAGSSFVGFDNYVNVFKDTTFTGSIGTTVVFTIVSVILEFLLGLLFALVLNQNFRGRGIARAAVLVPWAFPTVISAVVWRDLLWQNNTGAIPALLHTFGLARSDWAPLATSGSLLAAMIVTDVWKTAPFMALLLLAGLQVIPDDIYEAGRVDGASVWQRFFSLTLPLLKPAILVALLFRTLDAWRAFDLFYVVAGQRLESLSLYAYQEVVNSTLGFPLGVAASVLIFLSAAFISVVFVKGFGTQTAA